MRMNKFSVLFTVLCVAMAVVCGCGKQNTSKNRKKNEQNNNCVTMQMRLTESLNPIEADKQSVRDALALCYEPMFGIDDKINTVGILAVGGRMSDDCMTATVNLKTDVSWHDGKQFTAADVAYTVEQIQETPSSPYAFCVKYIEDVIVLDASTVKFELSRPYARFFYSLYFPIIPSHIKNIDEKIVGTGAYCEESYNPSGTLELTANASWHGGETENKKIIISVMRDNETAASAFNTGVVNTITNESFDLGNYALKSGTRSVKYPSSKYEFMAFNHNREIFSEPEMRSAVSMAIDRSEIVKECYNSYAVEANTPIHPFSASAAPSTSFIEYNMENALEMFFYEGYSPDDKSGLLKDENGNGISFTILVNEENAFRCACAEMIASQLSRIGVSVEVNKLSYNQYSSRIKSCDYDAYLGGTKLGNIYDFEFLFSDGGSLNNYGFSEKYMELALSGIASSPSENSMHDALLNFEEIFVREQPVCGISFLNDVLITSNKVTGKLLPSMNFPYSGAYGWKMKFD